MGHRGRGFTIVELLVVIGIIIFITALSIPAFNSFFRNQGIAKAARMVQTAVMQSRTTAVSVGRQHMLLFKNDYDGEPGNTVILVMDCGEDMDGDGSPWVDATGAWETDATDGSGLVAKVSVPSGFTWMPGRVEIGEAAQDLPGTPVVMCMPDGTLRLYEERTAAPFLSTSFPMTTTDKFNDDTLNYHELAVRRGGAGDRYLLHFIKSSGRVKIKAEPAP